MPGTVVDVPMLVAPYELLLKVSQCDILTVYISAEWLGLVGDGSWLY